MLRIERFDPCRHGQIQLDTIIAPPFAMNGRKTPGRWRHLVAPAVYRNRGSLGPRWNPKPYGELPRLRGIDVELHHTVERVETFLGQHYLCATLRPSQDGWNIQIHPYALRIAEISVDAIIGCDLGQRARAAGPVLSVRVNLSSLAGIVGVI